MASCSTELIKLWAWNLPFLWSEWHKPKEINMYVSWFSLSQTHPNIKSITALFTLFFKPRQLLNSVPRLIHVNYLTLVRHSRCNAVLSWMCHWGCWCSHSLHWGDIFLKAFSFNTSKVNDYILDGGMTEIPNGHTVIVGKQREALKMRRESCTVGFIHHVIFRSDIS